MKLLEVFNGTGSAGIVAKSYHWGVISLDLKSASTAIFIPWDHKQIPWGHFEMVWASPPCIEYSVAKTVGVKKD